MIDNKRGLINLRELETHLQEQLQLNVSCLLREQTLTIVVHAPEAITLSPQAILSLVKTVVAQDDHLSSYSLQTYVVVHGQNQLQPTIALELPSLTSQALFVPNKTQKIDKFFINTFIWAKTNLLSEKYLKILTLGIGASLLVGSLYIFTRPCVIGICPDLTQAQKLAENAVNTLNLSSSIEEILTTHQNLTQSIVILQNIPPWSNYHSQAVTLLTDYQVQSKQLTQILQSLEIATQAVSLGQKAPLSVSQWQKVEQLWQKTLLPLATLPANSLFYPLAQVKLNQYQNNLIIVRANIQAEQKAGNSLNMAQEAAKVAKARQKSAQTLADRQFIITTWQSAIQYLKEIPPTTTSFKEAKQLINIYFSQLITAQSHQEREKLATTNYNYALQQAKLAETSANQKQWSSAVSYWQKGLTYLKQIPQTTFQYNQSQTLIASYKLSLNQAQKNLKVALRQKQIYQDLKNTCQKICNYKISNNLIQINLTEAYTKQVQQTALQAQAQTNVKTQIDLLNHLNRLEKSLQTISNNTGRSVEVYNSQQILMAVYEPRR